MIFFLFQVNQQRPIQKYLSLRLILCGQLTTFIRNNGQRTVWSEKQSQNLLIMKFVAKLNLESFGIFLNKFVAITSFDVEMHANLVVFT